MSTVLDLVYQYRRLLGKCERRVGVDMEEIQTITTIEQLFRSRETRRTFARVAVTFNATLRSRGMRDAVRVGNIGLGGVVCEGCPYLESGDNVELIIEDDELSISYRFRAEVVWTKYDDNDDVNAGLRFIGTPVLMRRRLRTETGLSRAVAA